MGAERLARDLDEAYDRTVGVRAIVRDGRLVVDEPTDLPNGTVLDLVVDDEGDALDDAERAALNLAISGSLREEIEGKTLPVQSILDKLRARRSG